MRRHDTILINPAMTPILTPSIMVRCRVAYVMTATIFDSDDANLGFEEASSSGFNSLRSMDYTVGHDSFTRPFSRIDGIYDHIASFLKGLAGPILNAIFRSAVPAAAYLTYHVVVDFLVNLVKDVHNYVLDVRGTKDSLRDILEEFKGPLSEIVFSYFEDLGKNPERAPQAQMRFKRRLTVFIGRLKKQHNMRINTEKAVEIIMKKADKKTAEAFKEAAQRAREGADPDISIVQLRQRIEDDL